MRGLLCESASDKALHRAVHGREAQSALQDDGSGAQAGGAQEGGRHDHQQLEGVSPITQCPLRMRMCNVPPWTSRRRF